VVVPLADREDRAGLGIGKKTYVGWEGRKQGVIKHAAMVKNAVPTADLVFGKKKSTTRGKSELH